MKVIILTLVICIMGSFAFAGIDTNISAENQVILPNSAWTPTEEQTKKALVSIQKFLYKTNGMNEWQKTEIQQIVTNSAKFRVQFTGVQKKERKIIRCNFFPLKRGDDNFSYWKEQEVIVDDGGFWYWQIEYDVEKDKCLNFSSNGYA